MANVNDYLDERTLQSVQQAFSAVLGRAVSIHAPDGSAVTSAVTNPPPDVALGALASEPLKRRSGARGGRKTPKTFEVPVHMDDELAGWIRVAPEGDESEAPFVPVERDNMLRLFAGVLGRLASDGMELRRRVEQLLALQHVLAEITGVHELQQILDAVTRITVDALKAKAGAIRLLSDDGDELVIRAVHSINPQYLDTNPIPISDSPLDRDVLAGREPVYVADVTRDPRVVYQDTARREGFVSALCAPMIFKDHREGVVRVFMDRRYEFDWFEKRLLQTIADSAAAAIANARLYAEAKDSWEIKRQIALAGEVQKRMIPETPPMMNGVDICARYIPSQELAGDFYDFIPLPSDNVGIAICDVVGKGVRASLLMASIRASLRAHASNIYEMSDVLGKVNRDLCADTVSSDFATMFYGVLNAKSRVFTYACAGHMPPILVRDGRICHLETKGGVLGILPDMIYPLDRFQLKPGDVVFAYTDGLSEALNFKNEAYGRTRIEEALLYAVAQNYNAEGIARYCLWDLRRFAGLRRREDDRTLIAVKIL
ncbi:MAG: SpoIIE family protein phosphatase [Phycisphaerae bacterium]|nr:SpoIIE family protein phosphatase [Phycisphaerae bacterium]